MANKKTIKKKKNFKIRTKKKIIGGNIPTTTLDNLNFLNDYEKIFDAGQRNCGIYIHKSEKKLIKCEKTHPIKEDSVLNKLINSGIKFFPSIYNQYIIETNSQNNKLFNSTYIEMEKLDGDITKLLYEQLPMKIINENFTDISKNIKDNIYELYQLLMPYTCLKECDYNNYNKIEKPLLFNDFAILRKITEFDLIELLDLFYPQQTNTSINFGNTNLTSDEEFDTIYKNLIKTDKEENSKNIKSLTLFYVLFKHKNTYKYIVKFYEIFIKELRIYIDIIRKKILDLEVKFAKYGNLYDDYKLDNFGFNYGKDKNIENINIYYIDFNGESFSHNTEVQLKTPEKIDKYISFLKKKYSNNNFIIDYSKYGQFSGDILVVINNNLRLIMLSYFPESKTLFDYMDQNFLKNGFMYKILI